MLSLSTEGLALSILVWMGIMHSEVLLHPVRDYHFIRLVNTTMAVPQQPAPAPLLIAPAPEPLQVQAEIRPVKAVLELPAAPKVELVAVKPLSLPNAAPLIPRQLVKTDVFSSGSPAEPVAMTRPEKVQTGGFGDPNGIPADENRGRQVNIAQMGTRDLPGGPGAGNGTGGARGVPVKIASAGFGDATAIGAAESNSSRRVVKESGFGDMAEQQPLRQHALRPEQAKTAPAEVLSKPNPVYTEEARRQHIEGEVLLEVVFSSSGQIRVVRVIRGLGYGLDESAIRAAEQIRFKPAIRDGQPADSTAVLHIMFQIA